MKIALGTAQFGMTYGLVNPHRQISATESADILKFARKSGISVIDTAIDYGESESTLGEVGVNGWNVVTKLPEVPECENVSKWVFDSVEQSITRLRLNSLYGLLLHRPSQLSSSIGYELYRALLSLKANGLIQKIGVSIYSPNELEEIFAIGHFDIVQSPFSIIDRRLERSGWLKSLVNQDVEIHARSVFLQGLLLIPRDKRPRKFDGWSDLWQRYDRWINETGRSQLDACLSYPLSIPEIDNVIVGVNGLGHLQEIVNASANVAFCLPPPIDLCTEDIALLNPVEWLKL